MVSYATPIARPAAAGPEPEPEPGPEGLVLIKLFPLAYMITHDRPM